nr:GNAT family N-acetyltransferase [Microbacterium bovistercoris]
MKDIQFECSPITVRSVRDNVLTIREGLVLIAEVDDVHVGYCLARVGLRAGDPVFMQVVAVAPAAQRRGIGRALLASAAEREPLRDIALATQDDNAAARAMNERFAEAIGGSIHRVNLDTFRPRDLGIQRGLGYRAWVIQRSGAG